MPILSKLRLKRAFSKLDSQLEKLPKQMSHDELLDFVFSPKGSLSEPRQLREEFDALTKEIEKIKPKFAMEIGTANGGTLFLLSRLSDPNAKIMGVDLPEGQLGGGYPEWKISFYKKFVLPGQQLQLNRGYSHAQSSLDEAKSFFSQDMLDCLFIDGDHIYDFVNQDHEMYCPCVRKGGRIVFHDIAEHKGSHYEVDEFWPEIKGRKICRYLVCDWNDEYYGVGVIVN